MKTKYAITFALALATVPIGARAKPHKQITDAQREDCLMKDADDDGTEFCMKYGKGMTQGQKDAWLDRETKKITDEVEARAVAAEADPAIHKEQLKQYLEEWDAQLHHAKKRRNNETVQPDDDTPGVDWQQVAALRGVAVSLDDCVKASAGLAAEYGK